MSDLISRDEVLRGARPEYLNPQQEKLSSYNQGWNNAIDEYFDRIKELPSAEPKRNTGKWITDTYGNIICSECGWCAPQIMTGCLADRHLIYDKSEFCWHCGADMRSK